MNRIQYAIEIGVGDGNLFISLLTVVSFLVALGSIFVCSILLVAVTGGFAAPLFPIAAILFLCRKTPPKETK